MRKRSKALRDILLLHKIHKETRCSILVQIGGNLCICIRLRVKNKIALMLSIRFCSIHPMQEYGGITLVLCNISTRFKYLPGGPTEHKDTHGDDNNSIEQIETI